MNYRHAYHAGNFADVFKHAVLALILDHLRRKETPFCVIDTHAGIGRYDLAGEAAQRTGEWRDGIGRLLAEEPPPGLEGYLAAVRAANQGRELRWYPGSPRLARWFLRPQDRLALVELHPEDAAALKREFDGDSRVGVHQMDAYTALKALLPPKERRGLVLIDPPFEVTDEFERIVRGLRQALKRWPTGIYAIWYPIKTRPPVDAFHAALAGLGAGPAVAAELLVHPERADRLNGCGIVVLHPPWMLDERLRQVLPDLARRLGKSQGEWRLSEIRATDSCGESSH